MFNLSANLSLFLVVFGTCQLNKRENRPEHTGHTGDGSRKVTSQSHWGLSRCFKKVKVIIHTLIEGVSQSRTKTDKEVTTIGSPCFFLSKLAMNTKNPGSLVSWKSLMSFGMGLILVYHQYLQNSS